MSNKGDEAEGHDAGDDPENSLAHLGNLLRVVEVRVNRLRDGDGTIVVLAGLGELVSLRAVKRTMR